MRIEVVFLGNLQLSATLGIGMEYDRREKLRYNVRGKKAFLVTTDGFLKFHIKGRCDTDKEFQKVSIYMKP